MDIQFPNLHINIENLPKSFNFFGVDIAFYGCIIALGMILGIALVCYIAKTSGQDYNEYIDFALYAIIFSVIGARLYYVLFSWDMYKDNLLEILNIREGGLAIYGGVIAAVLTVIIAAKIKHLSAPQIFDTIALALLNGQMLGRWGNFFNREAFGGYTDSLFAMRLPIDAVRSSDVTEQMRAHIQMIDGVEYIQVHPTFLYESLWCCALLILLFAYRKHKKYEGELFLLYMFGYGLGRAWIEGLRTDQLLLPGIGLPVSQLLAGVLVVTTGVLLVYLRKNHSRYSMLAKKSTGK